MRGRDDLDALAVVQLGSEGHQLVVDLDRDAAVADVGVHGVGEINRGRAARQRQDLAFRREHVDRVGEEVDLQVFEKLVRIAAAGLDLKQALQPLVGLLLQVAERRIGALVEPVRGEGRAAWFSRFVVLLI